MQQDHQAFFAANQELWNTRTGLHIESRFYDNEAFKAGQSSLKSIELTELGDEVKGKSLLHLQCHFGQDSLSWARMGAQVTGVDFSDAAIEQAQKLAAELKLDASFLQSNVLELIGKLDQQFDIVYTSYGVLGWLPDLDLWARNVYHHLKPGGTFYMVEFHPLFQQINEKEEIHYDYFYRPEPDEEVAEVTYADGAAHAPIKEYWWNHPFSRTLTALVNSGLQLEYVREFPFSPYKLAESMDEIAPDQYQYRQLKNRIPYVFSVKGKKGI